MEINRDGQEENLSLLSYQPLQDHDHTLVCVRTDVYELHTPKTDEPAKWDIKCSSEPLSICYDSFRFMYRAICLKDTNIIVNSCIMPDSVLTKTAPLFCTWNDERSKKFFGFGFKQQILIEKFVQAFAEAKKNMGDLLSHVAPVSNNPTKQFQINPPPPPLPWQQTPPPPILLNYNVAVQPFPQPPPPMFRPFENEPSTSPGFSHSNEHHVLETPKTDKHRTVYKNPNSKFNLSNVPTPFQMSRTDTKSGKSLGFNMTNYATNKGLGIFNATGFDSNSEVTRIHEDNHQIKERLGANYTKLNELKSEFETLNHRNNIIQKSNDVLESNAGTIQTKYYEAEKNLRHWKELGEKSEFERKQKMQDSMAKQKSLLEELIQQRENLKKHTVQQQMEISNLRNQEQNIQEALGKFTADNKLATLTQNKIHNDYLLIEKITQEQLIASKEIENKIELILQGLLEASVDIKKSVKKTSSLMHHQSK